MNLIDKSDKIFIAGHKGMVGGAILKELIASEYGPNNGGKILTAKRENLNLLDQVKVKEWFKQNKPNVVIIAAAKVGGIYANDKYRTEFLLENLRIQNNLIQTAWEEGVKRLLFLGSSCIYPKFSEQPIKEESLLSGPLEPTNENYAIAKIAGIKLCESLRKQYNFDAISLMPTNLYGFGDNYHSRNSHVIPSLIKKFCDAKEHNLKTVECWGSGSPKREFLHVSDLAKACKIALEKWDPNNKNSPKNILGEPLSFLNVGSGEEIAIRDLANQISNIVSFKGQITWNNKFADGTPRKILDISRIQKLGWKPRISLKEGLEKTINEYQNKITLIKNKYS